MRIPFKQTGYYLLGFIIGYLAMYGLSTMILEMAARYALESKRRAIRVILASGSKITRENCPHCEHWHNEGMECCMCRMPPDKEDEDKSEAEKVTVQ